MEEENKEVCCPKCGTKTVVVEGDILDLQSSLLLRVKCLRCKHKFLVTVNIMVPSREEMLKLARNDKKLRDYITLN
jgi:prepilin signal peptidase PulO-like enzyme (type II secretory pathway)